MSGLYEVITLQVCADLLSTYKGIPCRLADTGSGRNVSLPWLAGSVGSNEDIYLGFYNYFTTG